jgi:hypothetical protein
MLNKSKYLLPVILLLAVSSPAYACGSCLDSLILRAIPGMLLVPVFYILWLIIFTGFTVVTKRPLPKNSHTVYPARYTVVKFWLLLPVWLALGVFFAMGSILAPAFIIGLIWIVYMVIQMVKWARMEEPAESEYLFIWLHRVTLIILLAGGIGLYILRAAIHTAG